MKIGPNFWIWVSPFRTDRDLGLIDKAKSMGADVVEFAIEDDGVVDAKLLRRALADHQMECSVVGIFGPQRDFASEDPAVRNQGLEHAKRCVDLTAEAGSTVFTVQSSPPDVISQSPSPSVTRGSCSPPRVSTTSGNTRLKRG